MQDRIFTLEEARVGYDPRRRRPPRKRATVLPSDPPWLHQGVTLRLTYRGNVVDAFSIGVVAKGAGRSVLTLRRLEDRGIIPKPFARTPGRGVAAQKRMYLRTEALAIVAALEQTGLVGRRPQRWSAPLIAPRA